MAHQLKKNLGVTLHRDSVEFRVWAPFAADVSIAVPYVSYDISNAVAMTREDDGYWSIKLADIEVGQTYKYLIKTPSGDVLRKNDPRGRALTASENGDSIIVGDTFDWGDDVFIAPPHNEQIIYELHIGTFNRKDPSTQGTFDDAIARLDYLRDLGINMIELMPVTSMAMSNGWGYNTEYIYSVENSYGGRWGMMEFVRACHEREIGVVLDLVYNHFSTTDLWQFDGWSENGRGGIYFYNDERGDTPWGGRPDFGRAEVRQFIADNITMWFTEYHIDGIRLDSTAYMRNLDGGDNPAREIADSWRVMQEITHIAHSIRPGALTIAEDTGGNTAVTLPASMGGAGFDAQWRLNFPHAVKYALGLNTAYPAALLTELTETYNSDAFSRVIFSDSHDTAANGFARISETASPDNPGSVIARKTSILASALTLTAPGIPMLLQGSEFLQGGSFNDWQVLDWTNVDQFPGIVLAHQHLTALRRNEYGNSRGLTGNSTAIFHEDPNNHVIAYHRWSEGGPGDDVIVVANLGDSHFNEYSLHFPVAGMWHVRFNSSWKGYSSDFHEVPCDYVITDASQTATIAIAAHSVLIFTQDDLYADTDEQPIEIAASR